MVVVLTEPTEDHSGDAAHLLDVCGHGGGTEGGATPAKTTSSSAAAASPRCLSVAVSRACHRPLPLFDWTAAFSLFCTALPNVPLVFGTKGV
jgi:hypothetical protein